MLGRLIEGARRLRDGVREAWRLVQRWVPLVGWVSYLPLLLVLAAVMAAIYGLGDALGAPSLIWHDWPTTQVWAGFAVASLGAHLGMVGYLLDSAEHPDQEVAPDRATLGSVARYVMWPVGAVALAVAISLPFEGETNYKGAGVLVGPLVACVALALLWKFGRTVRLVPPLLPLRWKARLTRVVRKRQKRAPKRGEATAPSLDPGAHAVQILVMAVLFAAYVVVSFNRTAVPAVVAVSLALMLATGIWGVLRFWARRLRFFGMAAVVVAACLSGVTRDEIIPKLAKIELSESRPPLLSDERVLGNWKKRLGEARPPLVVVATSGGASRAAVWTINVLARLEQTIPGFLKHVRLITGASGGMVGAGHLVAAMGPNGLTVPIEEVIEGAALDSLTDVTRALILPGKDRGRALEEVWERNSGGRMAKAFRELALGEDEGWRPSLVYTPMLVEDGRRLVVSNLELGSITESIGPRLACKGDCPQSRAAVQLFACAGEGLDTFKLSTAARLSATFPWITSAGVLPSTPERRVVDSGYYDNYGVDLAAAWMHKNAAWLRDNTSGVLLVRIRDAVTHPFDVHYPGGPGPLHKWASAVSTPVEAILSAREATMSFRNDDKVSLLAKDARLLPGTRFFVTEDFEFTGEAPLEWYLSRASIDHLREPPKRKPLVRIRDWWRDRLVTMNQGPLQGPPADAARVVRPPE